MLGFFSKGLALRDSSNDSFMDHDSLFVDALVLTETSISTRDWCLKSSNSNTFFAPKPLAFSTPFNEAM